MIYEDYSRVEYTSGLALNPDGTELVAYFQNDGGVNGSDQGYLIIMDT